jgi:hypothetical protein
VPNRFEVDHFDRDRLFRFGVEPARSKARQHTPMREAARTPTLCTGSGKRAPHNSPLEYIAKAALPDLCDSLEAVLISGSLSHHSRRSHGDESDDQAQSWSCL